MAEKGTESSSGSRQPTVLVVDDEEWVRDACGVILSKEGCRVVVAPDARQGLELLVQHRPDLALVDVRMPGINGIEFIRRARSVDGDLVAVMVTGYGTIEVAVEAMKAGAYDFLPKPFEPRELRAVVRRGLEQRQCIRAASEIAAEKGGFAIPKTAILYHQLKGPVASLRQCLTVVLEGYAGDVSDKARQMIGFAARRADQLIHLLNNWVILARLEDGDFVSQSEMLDLVHVAQQVVASYADAPERGSRKFDCVAHGQVIVKGDSNALSELLRNLLNNAMLYTPDDAHVRVEVSIVGDDAVARVSDNGPGIPPEEQERVFEAFYRGQAQRGIPGDGLGLPIARRIARLHGGELRIESTEAPGCAFVLTLPAMEGKGQLVCVQPQGSGGGGA